jgi:F0F1-type ATP synthase assembly protein I
MAQSDKNPRSMVFTLLVVMVGLVGCLTLVVIFAGLLVGRWLDSLLGTTPVFTLVLLLAGIPVSVILMLYVARRTLDRMRAQAETDKKAISS